MKTFNASDMAHKRTEIFEAAKDGGAIIQKKNTNGEVLEEFALVSACDLVGMYSDAGHDIADEFILKY